MSDEASKDIILLGKPLSEYPKTPEWLMDDIRRHEFFSEHNREVHRSRYKNEKYLDLGLDIVSVKSDEFGTADRIIARARFFATEVLDGLDMTPLIPYIEWGLLFNKEYEKLVKELIPVFQRFNKWYGYLASSTIPKWLDHEFWQGTFAPEFNGIPGTKTIDLDELKKENEL